MPAQVNNPSTSPRNDISSGLAKYRIMIPYTGAKNAPKIYTPDAMSSECACSWSSEKATAGLRHQMLSFCTVGAMPPWKQWTNVRAQCIVRLGSAAICTQRHGRLEGVYLIGIVFRLEHHEAKVFRVLTGGVEQQLQQRYERFDGVCGKAVQATVLRNVLITFQQAAELFGQSSHGGAGSAAMRSEYADLFDVVPMNMHDMWQRKRIKPDTHQATNTAYQWHRDARRLTASSPDQTFRRAL